MTPRVLLAEDEAIPARAARIILERMGCKVTAVVASGEAAISEAERSQLDLVLMDVRLRGEMGGVEAAKVINARFGTPIVFVSAYSEQELRERQNLPDDFKCLSKPIGEGELAAAIDDMLASSTGTPGTATRK